MPNFGLMSGNPYYYGPSGLAAGVGAFADNLLKAYGTLVGINQRQQEIEMQKKLMQIKLDEEANKVKQREAMEAYEKGLAKPVQGLMAQTQTFTPPDEIPSEWTWTPEARQVQPETVISQVPTTYANQIEAWKAEGKNPEIEYLRGAYSTIAKYDPEKALALREKLYSATTNAELKEALLSLKRAAMDYEMGLKEKGLDFKNMEYNLKRDALNEAIRAHQANELIRATRGANGPKESDLRMAYKEAKANGSFEGDFAAFMQYMNSTRTDEQIRRDAAKPGKQKRSLGDLRPGGSGASPNAGSTTNSRFRGLW